jgi:lysozyme
MTVDVKELYEEISSDEGKVLHAYLCSELHATVGIGHKILDTDPEKELDIFGINWEEVPDDQYITEDRCYILFQEDVQVAISGCMKIYNNWDDLPQEVQHILVNMCFQLGQRGLSNFKQMGKAIEESDWEKASVEMMDSRWAKQTPQRAERLKNRMLALASV